MFNIVFITRDWKKVQKLVRDVMVILPEPYTTKGTMEESTTGFEIFVNNERMFSLSYIGEEEKYISVVHQSYMKELVLGSAITDYLVREEILGFENFPIVAVAPIIKRYPQADIRQYYSPYSYELVMNYFGEFKERHRVTITSFKMGANQIEIKWNRVYHELAKLRRIIPYIDSFRLLSIIAKSGTEEARLVSDILESLQKKVIKFKAGYGKEKIKLEEDVLSIDLIQLEGVSEEAFLNAYINYFSEQGYRIETNLKLFTKGGIVIEVTSRKDGGGHRFKVELRENRKELDSVIGDIFRFYQENVRNLYSLRKQPIVEYRVNFRLEKSPTLDWWKRQNFKLEIETHVSRGYKSEKKKLAREIVTTEYRCEIVAYPFESYESDRTLNFEFIVKYQELQNIPNPASAIYGLAQEVVNEILGRFFTFLIQLH